MSIALLNRQVQNESRANSRFSRSTIDKKIKKEEKKAIFQIGVGVIIFDEAVYVYMPFSVGISAYILCYSRFIT